MEQFSLFHCLPSDRGIHSPMADLRAIDPNRPRIFVTQDDHLVAPVRSVIFSLSETGK